MKNATATLKSILLILQPCDDMIIIDSETNKGLYKGEVLDCWYEMKYHLNSTVVGLSHFDNAYILKITKYV